MVVVRHKIGSAILTECLKPGENFFLLLQCKYIYQDDESLL